MRGWLQAEWEAASRAAWAAALKSTAEDRAPLQI